MKTFKIAVYDPSRVDNNGDILSDEYIYCDGEATETDAQYLYNHYLKKVKVIKKLGFMPSFKTYNY